MVALKIQKIGDSLTIVLTEEARALLGAREGDVLHLDSSEDQGITIAMAPPTLEERRERGRGFLRRYRATFEALAK